MFNPDILIIGAGPTGLTLANLLAKSGVNFMLIDSKDNPSKDSKAFGIHARSLEVFRQLGLSEILINEGNIENTFHILSRGQEAARFKLSKILPGETPYPYFLILPQDRTERILTDALNEQGQQIYWRNRLIGLSCSDQIYHAEITDAQENTYHIHPKYIVGCDGANSTVRKNIGIPFKGKSITTLFNLADVVLETPLIHGDVYFTIAPGHLSVIFSYKKKDHFRVFNFLNTAVRKHKKEKLKESEVQQILTDNPALKAKLKSMHWSSVYHIHCRMADRFMKGNVLLAGDAAHVHSPVGGQGMNTGIQDAFNLAWKIEWSLKQTNNPKLLQSYQEERYPIARNLHYSTDKIFQLLITQNRLMDLFRLNVLPFSFFLLSNSLFLKILFRRISQISIKYSKSSINLNQKMGKFAFLIPKAGDRAPWLEVYIGGKKASIYDLFDYRYFTLLLAGGSSDYQNIIEVLDGLIGKPIKLKVYYLKKSKNLAFYKTYGISSAAIFLIRPDGHIAYRSNKIEKKGIEGYLKSILLVP